MHKSFTKLLTAAVAVVTLLASTTVALAQGITTGAIVGTALNSSGQPVSGAAVTIVHEPSGTRATGVTRANGQYNVSGLRVGGPYTVTISADTYQETVRREIYVEPGSSVDVSAKLASSGIVQLEAFNVVSNRDTTFGAGKMGTGTAFSETEVSNVTSVRRNIQDIAVLDSRMFLGSLDQGGQLSAQGQNFRFNSLLVDGVRSDDQFGLNSNGFSSLRGPVPIDAIQSLGVELNPYSGRYSGFTGALINTTIISGTNQFSGKIYYEVSSENLRAKNPLTGVKESFDEKSYGIVFSGPILRNRLFFSYVYDNFKRTTVPPQANFIPGSAGLQQITDRAKALGYDAGTFGGGADNVSTQETHIGKLDWNISDKHRLALTYRRNYGVESIFPNYTSATTTSLSGHWYTQNRNTDSYVAQLNSQWSSDFRTELTGSYTKYDGSPQNSAAAFPMVTVNGVSGTRASDNATIAGSVVLGTENSRQLNKLNTEEKQFKAIGEWSRGDHTFTFGLEDVATDYVNAFVQNTNGVYSFASINDWIAGTPPSSFQLAKPYAGATIENAIARWGYDNYAAFLEDTWRPNNKLTLLYGVRFDYPYIGEAPPVAAGFQNAFGIANNTTNSGNYTVAPRVGFSYELDTQRKTQIRGGVGLFQGKNPAVWLSNAYSNAGSVYNYTASTAERASIVFNPDPNTQTVPGSANPAPNINVTDKDFVQPRLWKSNIAIDHELPFGGITATVEYYFNKVDRSVNTVYLNYLEAGTLPDGRIRYAGAPTPTGSFPISGITTTAQAQAAFGSVASVNSSGQVSFASSSLGGRRRVSTFADVFYLTNTDKGQAWGTTFSLARPMKNKWGWSLSYTHGNATEVSPITSSTASSNYQNRAVFNPNEDIASTSNTSIKDRIVASITRQFEFIKKAPTTVSLVYQGRTGHPYSWVFRGDANGDGYTFNDLLYVPTGPNDPKVTWGSTSERDAFFAFVESTSLAKYKGGHAPRNSETSPWLQTVDLKFTQVLPLYKKVRAELYLNVLNFANLLNDKWGIQEEVPFSYRRAVAGATYNAATNSWAYTFNNTTLNTVPTTVDDTPVSRWQVLAGMRIKF
ncbi:MAG: TonB-dependent receptor [Candidatus Didemnitutus sp.]|nr:TonB-dependent receptor [Candidatus Didemnitutus sp.]